MASSDFEHLQKLTVAALKAELAERGLDVTGKKQDLVVRLQEAFLRESTNEGHEMDTGEKSNEVNDVREETDEQPASNEEHAEAKVDAEGDRENSFTREEDEELNYNEEDDDYEGTTELESENFAADPEESEHVEGNGTEEAEHEAHEATDEKTAEDGEGEGNVDVILLDSHSEVDGGAGTVADVSEVAVTSTCTDGGAENGGNAKKQTAKKTEKPASTAVRVFIPPSKEYRIEKMVAQRTHMVVLYPLSYEDSVKPVVVEQILKSINYSVRCSRSSTNGTLFGHCILEFGTTGDAAKAAEALAGFSEVAKVYQMTMHDQHIGDVRRKLDDNKFVDEYNSSDTAEDRTVYACKLPKTVTEEQLVELFPDASCVLLPRNRDETKGRAYLEFESREAAKKVVKSETPLKLGDVEVITRLLTSDVSIQSKLAARKKRYEHIQEKKKAAESGKADDKKDSLTSRGRGGNNRLANRGTKRPATGVDLRSQLSKRPFVGNEPRRGGGVGGGFQRPSSRNLVGRLSSGRGGRSVGPSPLISSSSSSSSISTPRSASFRRNDQQSRSAGPQMRMQQRLSDNYSDRFGRMSEGSSMASRLSSQRYGSMSGERSSSWGMDRALDMGGDSRGSLFSSDMRSGETRFGGGGGGGFDGGDFRGGASQRDFFDDQPMRGAVRSMSGATPLLRPSQLDDGPAYGRGLMEQRMGPQGGRMGGGQFENRREMAVDEAIRAVQRQQGGVDDGMLIQPSRDDLMGLKRQVVMRDLPQQGQGQGSLLGWPGAQSAGSQYRAAAPQMRQNETVKWGQPAAMNRNLPASNMGYPNAGAGGYDSYGQGQGQGQGYMAARRRY